MVFILKSVQWESLITHLYVESMSRHLSIMISEGAAQCSDKAVLFVSGRNCCFDSRRPRALLAPGHQSLVDIHPSNLLFVVLHVISMCVWTIWEMDMCFNLKIGFYQYRDFFLYFYRNDDSQTDKTGFLYWNRPLVSVSKRAVPCSTS